MMEFKDLTERIIGCAFRVYSKMGFGFLEAVYAKCLMIELAKAGIAAAMHYPVPVYYDDQPVGEYLTDALVEGEIILELESVRQLALVHEVQLVHCLTATGKDVGLVINFGEHTVEVKRKVRVLADSF
jgi:GxxExxY protein